MLSNVALKKRWWDYSTCVLATLRAIVCNVAVEREDHACRKSVGAITVTVNAVDSFQFLPFKILVLVSPSEVLKVAASQFSPIVNMITGHMHTRTKVFSNLECILIGFVFLLHYCLLPTRATLSLMSSLPLLSQAVLNVCGVSENLITLLVHQPS